MHYFKFELNFEWFNKSYSSYTDISISNKAQKLNSNQ